MYEFLGTIGHAGVGVGLIILIIAMILIFKWVLRYNEEKILSSKTHVNELDKKHYVVDLQKYKPLLTNIGLSLALLVVLAAFEVPELEDIGLANLGTLSDEAEEQIEIPPTEHKPPPPPKIKQPKIIEIPDEEEIEEEIEVELDIEITEETIVEEIIEEEPEEENVDQIFQIVEEQASFPGGEALFYKFIKKNVVFPNQARRMGIEGKVYIQFVVERDGSLTDIKVIKGIGGGCDEEAIRVLKKVPKWNPGKQRGKPVRQRIVIPINFKLG